MEFGSIERELQIDASVEVVYEVICSPEHLREWWPTEADLTPEVGSVGVITFGDPASPDAKVERLAIVEADAPRRLAFRWVYGDDPSATATNSLLVTFDLTPDGDATHAALQRDRLPRTRLGGRRTGGGLSGSCRGLGPVPGAAGRLCQGLVVQS